MKSAILMGLAALALPACNRAESSEAAERARTANLAADDTGKNARDRNTGALTPADQGENAVDLGITQQVRRTVVKDGTLSMTAKNCKIITMDGVVTLRGAVKSAGEKRLIVAVAQGVDGVKRVDDQLEVAPD